MAMAGSTASHFLLFLRQIRIKKSNVLLCNLLFLTKGPTEGAATRVDCIVKDRSSLIGHYSLEPLRSLKLKDCLISRLIDENDTRGVGQDFLPVVSSLSKRSPQVVAFSKVFFLSSSNQANSSLRCSKLSSKRLISSCLASCRFRTSIDKILQLKDSAYPNLYLQYSISAEAESVMAEPSIAAETRQTTTIPERLQLHGSDHPGMVLVSAPLTGNNYLNWSFGVKHALRAKMKLGFIDGTSIKPSANDPHFEQWIRVDSMVTTWILNSIF
ncbi:UNVERIFIED_CONTAM: hypothetical protein Scaly_0078000 [Sesamum calycinum]|uniref:Retrotransposon Copia-like N-terminal domain-containing protein n=1 Tax=Sesamum calycinum TaxID=2727403 RepID=A0AAW2SXM2_9LAMI